MALAVSLPGRRGARRPDRGGAVRRRPRSSWPRASSLPSPGCSSCCRRSSLSTSDSRGRSAGTAASASCSRARPWLPSRQVRSSPRARSPSRAGRGGVRRRVAAGAIGWLSVGWALGAPVLGPLALAANALRGKDAPGVALVAAFACLLVLAGCWVRLASRRPERRPTTGRTSTRLVRGDTAAMSAAVGALLARRNDVRLASVGAVVFGAGGVALASSVGRTGARGPHARHDDGAARIGGRVARRLRRASRRRLALARRAARHGRVAGARGSSAWCSRWLPSSRSGRSRSIVSPASWSAVGTVAVARPSSAADVAVVAGALVPWRGGRGRSADDASPPSARSRSRRRSASGSSPRGWSRSVPPIPSSRSCSVARPGGRRRGAAAQPRGGPGMIGAGDTIRFAPGVRARGGPARGRGPGRVLAAQRQRGVRARARRPPSR